MEIIFRLIEFLVNALLDQNDPNKRPAARSQASISVPAQRSQTRPMAPLTRAVLQNPLDNGEGWRVAVTALAIAVLVFMVAAWIMYMQGWL